VKPAGLKRTACDFQDDALTRLGPGGFIDAGCSSPGQEPSKIMFVKTSYLLFEDAGTNCLLVPLTQETDLPCNNQHGILHEKSRGTLQKGG